MNKIMVYLLVVLIFMAGCRGSSDPAGPGRDVVTTPAGVRGDPVWTKPVTPPK